jgi:hypothetical protein
MKKVILVVATLLSSVAFAQQGPQGSRPEPSAEMKAAFEACKSSGKPGDTAFESCMSSKGFAKPSGTPPNSSSSSSMK